MGIIPYQSIAAITPHVDFMLIILHPFISFRASTLMVGRQEGQPACKKTEWWGTGVVICLEQGADLHMAQLMPLPLTVSCFSEIQIGFNFLVLAHLGSPGKRAVKRVCVCVLHPFNGLFSRTTWVSQYQKGKTSLDLNEARDDAVLGWQWHDLDHMQTICTSLQTDNHTNTSSLNSYRPYAVPYAKPTVSKQ